MAKHRRELLIALLLVVGAVVFRVLLLISPGLTLFTLLELTPIPASFTQV